MRRRLVVIGAPSSAGSYAPGQEGAPAALRQLGLIGLLASGREVRDAGDGPFQVWAPDPAHPRVQNLDAVVRSVTAVAEQVGAALNEDADVLVVGGNCTVALGVMDALLQHDSDAGLLYIDRHFDLNTPASTSDGALDWMGLAHGLDLPDCADALASAFHRRPLLRPAELYLLGVDESLATDWERQQATQLGLRRCSHTALATEPEARVTDALAALPPGSLAVHLDVDALDFIDSPLAENTDGRNSGPTLDAIGRVLTAGCNDPRFRVLSIGELNPARAAGSPQKLRDFVSTLQAALGATGTAVPVRSSADCVGGADYVVAMPKEELPELVVADAEALRTWLLAHHATSAGVWLALTKKGGRRTTLTWQQAVDEALCVGWIDGQARKRDDETSVIRFTPRGPRSSWSARNVDHVERLEKEGRMLPAGRAAVEAAKADGRWQAAYAPQSAAEMPADLVAAIAANPQAQAMFEVLTKANRYALIYRLGSVKRAETRERKIGEFVAMLARHETIHPQTARPAHPAQ